jgi:hypothetical protein
MLHCWHPAFLLPSTPMKEWLRKPAARYILLFIIFAGGLALLRQTPVDVKLTLELDRSIRLGVMVMNGVELKILDADGTWISTSTFDFPAEIYPLGPKDTRTNPIALKLNKGIYTAVITMKYRFIDKPGEPTPLVRSFTFEANDESDKILLRP